MDVEEILDGILLGIGQVVVDDVVAYEVVLLDDVLPSLVLAAVGKVEVDETKVFQSFVLHLAVRQSHLAGRAPCAPHVEQNQSATVWLDYLAEYLLAVAHVGEVVV